MLVLTRKSQESVVVGGSVGFEHLLKVIVLEIDGGKVRLGFEVDQSVPVHRSEVWERIRANSQPSTTTTKVRAARAGPKNSDGLVEKPRGSDPRD